MIYRIELNSFRFTSADLRAFKISDSYLQIQHEKKRYGNPKDLIVFVRGEHFGKIGVVREPFCELVADIDRKAKSYELSIDEELWDKTRQLVLLVETDYISPKQKGNEGMYGNQMQEITASQFLMKRHGLLNEQKV